MSCLSLICVCLSVSPSIFFPNRWTARALTISLFFSVSLYCFSFISALWQRISFVLRVGLALSACPWVYPVATEFYVKMFLPAGLQMPRPFQILQVFFGDRFYETYLTGLRMWRNMRKKRGTKRHNITFSYRKLFHHLFRKSNAFTN